MDRLRPGESGMRFPFLTQKVLLKKLKTVCFQLMTQNVISHYLRQISLRQAGAWGRVSPSVMSPETISHEYSIM